MFFFFSKLPIPSSFLCIANIWYRISILTTFPTSDQSILDSTASHDHFTRRQRAVSAMDPTTKLIIDEFARRFDTHEERWERRFADFERTSADRSTAVDCRLAALESTTTSSSSNDVSQRLTELELTHAEQESTVAKRLADLESIRVEPVAKDHDARVTALEAIARDVSTWRLELEGVVDDLRLRVQKVPKIYDRTVFDSSSH